MTATVTLPQIARHEDELTLGHVEPADQHAQLIVALVALVDGPVDPSALVPAALVLSCEGFVSLPGVTFGCNYDLDVRSFELRQGYARAIDGGRLTLHSRKISVNPNFRPHPADAEARARATELFSLERRELMRLARHHLLRDAAD